MVFVFTVMIISLVIFYNGFDYALLEPVYSGNKSKREPAKKIELRGCWDFI